MQADRRWKQMPPDPLDRFARDLLVDAWEQEAALVSTRNPSHPSMDEVRCQRLPAVLARLNTETLYELMPVRREMAVKEIPGLPERLALSYAVAVLEAESSQRRGVAADDTFIAHQDGGVLTIQHKASGLRATFSTHSSAPGFGEVYSKPYRIASADPDNPGVSGDWERYVGLGIGARVYAEAARLRPQIRWISNATTGHSHGLRTRLHTQDPYTWSGSCEWCYKRGIDWYGAAPGDFAEHPRT